MRRVWLITRREFLTTVSGKGFLIGLLVMPALILLLVFLVPRILASRSPQVQGEVVVIDRAGGVLASLRTQLDPVTIEARRAEGRRRGLERAAPGFGQAAPQTGGPPIPALTLVERGADTDLQQQKDWLAQQIPGQRHLGLIVIHPDAVVRGEGKPDYGTYDLYIAAGLDDATVGVIHEGLRLSLVGSRLKASGVDPAAVETSMNVERPNPVIVATDGQQKSRTGFNRALPFIMGLLLFMGVITGGQTLMASTIEEKSNRVVEVLLAAVSPLELMWGKLLGQLSVSLLVMAVYIGLGVLGMFQFAIIGLLDPMLVVYLLLFFLITYLVFGALMLSIGAAVNQLADAQSFMGPIMLLLIAPYVMAPMIGQAPNSTFSVIASFVPPVNTFAMLARLASATPPPMWQVWLTMLVGLGAASACVWFAAKIFKVGLLMHGKPPNLATLIRWARMA
ncbi:MAG TPA: ABC transporter permease [Steroidobacteraceae bacterium]|jgi:ABC-2 type transport system permease protein|nr:ABC transporter permease [Steroidobacteraceae bacterium]